MVRYLFFLLMLILFYSSCEEEEGRLTYIFNKIKKKTVKQSKYKIEDYEISKKKSDTINYNNSEQYYPISHEPLIYRTEKIWAQSTSKHLFSDTLDEDFFALKIIGDKDFTAMAYLTIMQKNEKLIFIDSFPFIELLGTEFDGGGYFATQTQQEMFARKYASEIFEEHNFKPITQIIYNENNEEISVVFYSFQYRVNKVKSIKITSNYKDKIVDKIALY